MKNLERLRDFENLEMKQELVDLLISNTPVAYIILDDQYRIHYINDNFLKLRNLDLDKTIGERCYNISNSGVPCTKCAVRRALDDGKKAFVTRKDILADGSVRYIDDYAIPLPDLNRDGKKYVLEIMVNRTHEMLAREQRDIDYDETLSILSTLLEAKDEYTATHSNSVRRVAFQLAKALKLPPEMIFEISVAASLHDIGKVRIPDSIINKPSRLTDEEFELIKTHPVVSYEMIKGLSSFENIKGIVKHHHEHWDGRGYPDKLSGDDIPLGARIAAIADTYDAITSTRSYRKALSHEYALEEIKRVAGTQLDPELVKVFLTMDFDADIDLAHRFSYDMPQVERQISSSLQNTEFNSVPSVGFSAYADKEMLLKEIFENTPCGYVLMDRQRNVLFASEYFLEYMGLGRDEVVGRKCYQAGGQGNTPCVNCAIERSLMSRKIEYMKQEQMTRNGKKYFDLFGMPLFNSDGRVEYIVEMIIDRTDEAILEIERARF